VQTAASTWSDRAFMALLLVNLVLMLRTYWVETWLLAVSFTLVLGVGLGIVQVQKPILARWFVLTTWLALIASLYLRLD
jgi:hypothetical protein